MTTTNAPQAPSASAPLALTSGRLPAYIEPAILVGVAVLIAGVQLLLGGFHLPSWLILTALLYLIAIGVYRHAD